MYFENHLHSHSYSGPHFYICTVYHTRMTVLCDSDQARSISHEAQLSGRTLETYSARRCKAHIPGCSPTMFRWQLKFHQLGTGREPASFAWEGHRTITWCRSCCDLIRSASGGGRSYITPPREPMMRKGKVFGHEYLGKYSKFGHENSFGGTLLKRVPPKLFS